VSTFGRPAQPAGLKAETGLSLEADGRRVQRPVAESPAGGTIQINDNLFTGIAQLPRARSSAWQSAGDRIGEAFNPGVSGSKEGFPLEIPTGPQQPPFIQDFLSKVKITEVFAQ